LRGTVASGPGETGNLLKVRDLKTGMIVGVSLAHAKPT
jgi:hypothetical protein